MLPVPKMSTRGAICCYSSQSLSRINMWKGRSLFAFVVVILPVTQDSKGWTSTPFRSAVKGEEAVYLVRRWREYREYQ
jgi:hypothetical protein